MTPADQISRIFNQLFAEQYRTTLTGGGDEPVYLPAVAGQPHRIVFRSDYETSALHEAAHWCYAGAARRKLPDYGYWYEPERDARSQHNFEIVESTPQAIEWVLSQAAGVRFRVSIDNFDHHACQPDRFKRSVRAALEKLFLKGFNPRMNSFAKALAQKMPAGNLQFDKLASYPDLPE